MKKLLGIISLILFIAGFTCAQLPKHADDSELAEITQRGRMLAEYDVAAWNATDRMMELKPKLGETTGYIARKFGDKWKVVFGRLSPKKDSYLVVYEAVQQEQPADFKIEKFETPKEDKKDFLNLAKALETATANFTKPEDRPYNSAVLPTTDGMFYVYFVPAQTQLGVFPLGGDVRFKISKNGDEILETRQLHKSIIEFTSPKEIEKVTAGYHTAILDEVPEDTDVFHVLAREPKVPEWVITKTFVYQIAVDGTARYVMTLEAFKKIGQKSH
jgi:hypothetical protein